MTCLIFIPLFAVIRTTSHLVPEQGGKGGEEQRNCGVRTHDQCPPGGQDGHRSQCFQVREQRLQTAGPTWPGYHRYTGKENQIIR